MEVAARSETSNLSFKFTIDTGASISILPVKFAKHLVVHPTPITLTAANNSPINVVGEATLEFSLGQLRRNFEWRFVIADTTKPLLGADFLTNFNLLVDCRNSRIVDPITDLYSVCNVSDYHVEFSVNNVSDVPCSVKYLLENYKSIISTTPTNERIGKVSHTIDTGNSPPTFCKTRRLSPEKEEAARAEFKTLLAQGIIRPSKSAWSSPLHLVKKSSGEWRPVGDYRSLNAISKPDRYPVPHLHSVTHKLKNKCVFSKIDLLKAYHQIPVHPSDIEKTAVSTPFGLYEYVYMPFGLKNAGATFQRIIDNMFMNFENCFAYFDDILIFSESEESHKNDLEKVFQILNENGLKISLKKCSFFQPKLDFLGYEISQNGLKPTESKLNDIKNFPQPKDSKSLRRFLGLINFYRKLVPHFAQKVYNLTELIKLKPNCNNLEFNSIEVRSFEQIKSELAQITYLPHPTRCSNTYQLVTDASNVAVGAALHQMVDGEPQPVGFFSKKLSETQKKYSAYDRELLAAYYAVLHFKHLIECRNVTIFSDHKPLVNAFYSKNIAKSDRQQRHLSLISEYINNMEYIKGDQNIVADCMSRAVSAVQIDAIDLPALALLQSQDNEIQEYKNDLFEYKISPKLTLLCDKSSFHPRPFVPLAARDSIFEQMHSLCHPGIKASLKIIKSRYYWPNMDRDIREKCRFCVKCQQAKVHRHTRSEVKNFEIPASRFEVVHIDIVGPLPPANEYNRMYTSDYRYILTCIDRSTRWIEAVPIRDIQASTIAVAFLEAWVTRFGVPLYVVSDRGSQFESELFSELSKMTGFHRLRTSSYHPQANGMIERKHRVLKNAIKARGTSWVQSLPIVLLGIMRIVPNDEGFSPFSAVTGSHMQIPRLITTESQTEFTSDAITYLAKSMKEIDFQNLSEGKFHSTPRSHIPEALKTCTHVWLRVDRVRKALEAPYTGPYAVLERRDKVFVIKDLSGASHTVSTDRLKPAFLKTPCPSVEIPPVSPLPTNGENHLPLPRCGEETQSDSTEETYIDAPVVDRQTRSGRRVRFKRNRDFVYY